LSGIREGFWYCVFLLSDGEDDILYTDVSILRKEKRIYLESYHFGHELKFYREESPCIDIFSCFIIKLKI
jgi:hypothetical protein